MTTERNLVKIYHEWTHLIADVQHSSTAHNQTIVNGLRGLANDYPEIVRNVASKKYWWFLIRRESILMARGKGGSASDSSRISSLGYLAPMSGLEDKIQKIRNLYGGRDLRDVWKTFGPWRKKQMLIMNIVYQDSRLSGIIARRAIEQNHFLDASLAADAKSRYDKKDPANPSLITGAWDAYNDIEYADVAIDAIARKDDLHQKLKKQLPSINF